MTLTSEQVAAITRALADPSRFAILRQIAATTSELPCCNVLEAQPLSPATVSHHLKELSQADLIQTRREGRGLVLSLRQDVWQAYLRELSALTPA